MTYSDQVYENVLQSVHRFLSAQPALKGVAVQFSEEFEPSRFYQKPFLLISDDTTRFEPMGIDGGFWQEQIDLANGSVDTIYSSLGRFDIRLDLGCDTVSDRRRWGAVIDRVLIDAEEAGIPVMNWAEDATGAAELGRLSYLREEDVAHQLLPEQPAVRTWRDVIRFTPRYLHRFVKAANQPLLTGVELQAKTSQIQTGG